jgi:hypothetical protein
MFSEIFPKIADSEFWIRWERVEIRSQLFLRILEKNICSLVVKTWLYCIQLVCTYNSFLKKRKKTKQTNKNVKNSGSALRARKDIFCKKIQKTRWERESALSVGALSVGIILCINYVFFLPNYLFLIIIFSTYFPCEMFKKKR